MPHRPPSETALSYAPAWQRRLELIELLVIVLAALTITVALWLHHEPTGQCGERTQVHSTLLRGPGVSPELDVRQQGSHAAGC